MFPPGEDQGRSVANGGRANGWDGWLQLAQIEPMGDLVSKGEEII